MANEFYDIIDRIGSKPVELVVGLNPDGDRRFMINVSYTFRNEDRRRVWLTRRQLESVHALLGAFLQGDEPGGAARTNTVNGNGTEPPF
jgi:hypothetical protein